MGKGTMIGIGIAVVVVLWIIGTYNKLVKRRLSCDEAFSAMDVYMKKRFDLIPNLVETVKGYARHEAETLEKVVELRNKATGTGEIAEYESQIEGALHHLFAVAEAYPDLKANENFRDLMASLNQVEEDIASSRRFYNAVVKDYNVILVKFPSNIIGNLFGFKSRAMFVVENPEERKNVKVSF